MPGCITFAKTTGQVSAVLKFANQTKTPVVTRGSGTGLSGGSLPVEPRKRVFENAFRIFVIRISFLIWDSLFVISIDSRLDLRHSFVIHFLTHACQI